jgi:hypothetical protein
MGGKGCGQRGSDRRPSWVPGPCNRGMRPGRGRCRWPAGRRRGRRTRAEDSWRMSAARKRTGGLLDGPSQPAFAMASRSASMARTRKPAAASLQARKPPPVPTSSTSCLSRGDSRETSNSAACSLSSEPEGFLLNACRRRASAALPSAVRPAARLEKGSSQSSQPPSAQAIWAARTSSSAGCRSPSLLHLTSALRAEGGNGASDARSSRYSIRNWRISALGLCLIAILPPMLVSRRGTERSVAGKAGLAAICRSAPQYSP